MRNALLTLLLLAIVGGMVAIWMTSRWSTHQPESETAREEQAVPTTMAEAPVEAEPVDRPPAGGADTGKDAGTAGTRPALSAAENDEVRPCLALFHQDRIEEGRSCLSKVKELDAWKKDFKQKCKDLVHDRKLGEATACFELMVMQDPEDSESHLGLGIIAAMQGKSDEAYHLYEKALELDPDGPQARTLERFMDQYDHYQQFRKQEADVPAQDSPLTPAPASRKQEASAPAQDSPLTPEQIADAINQQARAMGECAKQQRERDPSFDGTVMLSFTIQPDGRATDARTTPSMPYVTGCIAFLVKRLVFPSFTGEPIQVGPMPLSLGKDEDAP